MDPDARQQRAETSPALGSGHLSWLEDPARAGQRTGVIVLPCPHLTTLCRRPRGDRPNAPIEQEGLQPHSEEAAQGSVDTRTKRGVGAAKESSSTAPCRIPWLSCTRNNLLLSENPRPNPQAVQCS